MHIKIQPSSLSGNVRIPGSKSHTIRAVAIASLADGKSIIEQPLDSLDTQAAVNTYRALGAVIDTVGPNWQIDGTAGKLQGTKEVIDVVVWLVAFGQNHRLAGARCGTTHAVGLLAVGVGAADHT